MSNGQGWPRIGVQNFSILGLALALVAWLPAATLAAQFSEWAAFAYEVHANQTYLRVDNQALALDVYLPQAGVEGAMFTAPGQREASAPLTAKSATIARTYPVLMYIHGGGWAYNNRHDVQLRLLPYLEKGFAVVNIDYRKIDSASAPAAVIDARCALNWVRQNAERFHFDTARIIVSGNSAGGHLAMMTGFATDSGQFDRLCWDGDGPNVAAVINWYGISDVYDLIQGDNIHAYAVQWLNAAGSDNDSAGPRTLAERVSPLTYLQPNPPAKKQAKHLPAVLSIHGNADKVVPYSQSLRLHQALNRLGVVNELHTVAGKGHGDFNRDEVGAIYQHIWTFLGEQKLLP